MNCSVPKARFANAFGNVGEAIEMTKIRDDIYKVSVPEGSVKVLFSGGFWTGYVKPEDESSNIYILDGNTDEYDNHTGSWSVYTPAVITGMSITVDGVTYTKGQTAIITPDTESIVITAFGNNFQNANFANTVSVVPGYVDYLSSGRWDISEDGTTATLKAIDFITYFEVATTAYEFGFSNDSQTTWVDSGIYVIYLTGDDITAPIISGVENGETYYTTQKVTVTDTNIDSITLNGEEVTDTIILEGNKDATYTIVAIDEVGIKTVVTVTMKPISTIGTPIDDITEDDVKSTDRDSVQAIINGVDELFLNENTTNDEKTALEKIKDKAAELIKKLDEAIKAINTENTEKTKDVTSENVTTADKTDLANAKADLEKALEVSGKNYTEDEKKAIEDELERIDAALTVIGNAEAVENKINNLPESITKNDEAAIKAAEEAYNALTDYEKSLVDKDAKKALDDAKAALAELEKSADNTQTDDNTKTDSNVPETGDNSNLRLWIALMFVSGGAILVLPIIAKREKSNKSK